MSQPKVRILHVDDDDANRYAVSRTLKHAGFDVTEAATGEEALRQAQAKPDLVILDVCLPDIDGTEVCRRIKRDPATSKIPVLHLSASRVSSEDKAYGLDSGAEGYLIRPVEPVELVATVNALLRARRSEEAFQERDQQFEALIGGVREYAIITADKAGLITSWRGGATRLFGYASQEVIGRPFSICIASEDTAAAAREMMIAAENGEFQGEGVRLRKDGTPFDAAVVVTATRSADGRVLGFLKLVQDITPRKRLEAFRAQQLANEQAARMEAERVGRMKDEFLATLSHEIRTPLNAILGWSQIMQAAGVEDESVRQGLEVIERNARAQAQIIDDLLDMSRIISGKIRLETQPVDLTAAARSAVETLRPTAEAKGVKLVAQFDGPADVVHADANRLQQVFWNLLSNAVKFTPVGGVVTVRTDRVGETYEVTVTDTGEGIEARFLPHVFDRFRQADASTTRRHGGLGLGLSIVKQIAELHGGGARVSSDGPGQGSAFTVSLPASPPAASVAAPGPDEVDARPARSPAVATPPVTLLDGVRVLVVDDEGDARLLMKRLLESRHASVTTVGSAAAALDVLCDTAFDVLVSDIGMPEEDGYSLVRRLRAMDGSCRDVPAVALTAYARTEDRDHALAAGFQAHVTKPVEAADLIAAVARLVNAN